MTEHRSYSDGEQALIDAGWPPALAKATLDPFQYAVQVRDVGVIVFESAEPVGTGWVRLLAGGDRGFSQEDSPQPGYPCPRGIEVRLADIVWAADAPHGS